MHLLLRTTVLQRQEENHNSIIKSSIHHDAVSSAVRVKETVKGSTLRHAAPGGYCGDCLSDQRCIAVHNPQPGNQASIQNDDMLHVRCLPVVVLMSLFADANPGDQVENSVQAEAALLRCNTGRGTKNGCSH